MRDPLRWFGALAVLGVALLLLGPRGLGQAGEAELEHLLSYALDRPVAFALEPGETEVRLLTWLETDPVVLADSRASEVYALGVRVTDRGGRIALDRVVWLPTHRSWRSFSERVRPQRVTGSSREVWDERSTRIAVAGLVPDGGTIEIRTVHAPSTAAVLLVAHRRAVAGRLRILRLLRDGDLDRREPLAPWPITSLPTAWQTHLAGVTWERLGALPPGDGPGVRTARLETWFERLQVEALPTAGSPVAPGGSLVWLLDGETTFEANVFTDYGQTPEPPTGPLRVRTAEGEAWVEPLPGAGWGPVAIRGLTEVIYTLDAAAPGRRWVEAHTIGGDPDRAQGQPPRLALDAERQAVAPDFREIEAWRALPGRPLEYALSAEEVARVTVRRPLGDKPEPDFTVTVVAVDAADAELGRWKASSPAVASAFERYVRGAGAAVTRVSEPLAVWLEPPPGVAGFRVEADVPIDVSIDVARRGDVLRGIARSDYQLPEDFPYAHRYAPYAERSAFARYPLDPEQLALEDRSVAIDVQVRWEALVEALPAGDAGLPRATLSLPGPFELLAEAGVAGGTDGGRVRVGDVPAVVRLPASGRLEIAYRVPLADVGRNLEIRVGDRRVSRQIVSAGGTLRVDGAGSGPVAVAIEGAESGDLFLAAGTGQPDWQVRRIWSVPADGELRISIPAGLTSLSVDAYRVGEAGALRWWIEGEGATPAGLFVERTASAGVVSAPWSGRGPARALTFASPSLQALRPIPLERADGSPPATLVLRAEGAGRVWVRAQASWASGRATAPRHVRQGAAP